MRGRSDGETLAREYLDALRHQRRLSPATLKNYGQAIELLFWLLIETELDSVEPAQIRRFVALTHSKGLAPRSLALMLSAWRGFYHWLVRHRGFKANPVLGVRAPKAARPLPKALSGEAAQRLLDEKPTLPALVRDAAMFELLYSSGLRLGELVSLNIDDGRLDLAVTSSNANVVSVLYGFGNGNFGGRTDYPAGSPAGATMWQARNPYRGD